MKKTAGDRTKERILKAGVKLWPHITFEAIAKRIDMSNHTGILYHFPNDTLKGAIIEYALEHDESKVIVQLIGAGDSAVDHLTRAERHRHFNAI